MSSTIFLIPSLLYAVRLRQVISLDIPTTNYDSLMLFNSSNPNDENGDEGAESLDFIDNAVVKYRRYKRKSCRKCVCGMINKRPKIRGGKPAYEHEFPWMVALVNNQKEFHCAAFIITGYHLVTAGHCLDQLSPGQIQVVAGQHNLASKGNNKRKIFKIKEFIKHPKYDRMDVINDIAIIKVKTEMKFNTLYIQPACLPEYGNRIYSGIMATVIGWGETEKEELATNLRKVDVPIISLEKCRQYLSYYHITKNEICAGFDKGGKDSCMGNSGGPLQIKTSNPNRMRVIGIVSWGGSCAEPKSPGVYTKVERFIYWIESKLGEECICKK